MGLMDRMKGAKEQAKEAMAGAKEQAKEVTARAKTAMEDLTGQAGAHTGTTPGGAPAGGMPTGVPTDMEEKLRYRDLAQKLKASGVEAPAVVDAIRRGDVDALSGSVSTEVDVTIKPADGAAYSTTIKQAMLPAMLDTLAQGEPVTVRYDPDEPTAALIYGGV